jgi:hypothetical protein
VARYETTLPGEVEAFVSHLDGHILGTSISASLEESHDVALGEARMVVRAYERYSAFGGNRVSLTVSVLASGGQLALCAITTGGSQAAFFKINRVGEGTFMEKAIAAIDGFRP